MLNKSRNSNRFDRIIKIALYVVLLLLVFTAIVFTYEVTKKEATATSKSDLMDFAVDSGKQSSQDNDSEGNESTLEKSNIQTSNTGKNVKSTTDKLARDIKKIIQNERGSYSISYQDTISNNNLVINPQKMTAASMIKLFVMIESYNQIKEGVINENEKITLTSSMKVGGTGSLSSRKDGTVLTIDQLIYLMITQSDNTATNILIDRITMDKINTTVQKLGCLDTVLQRKMMDFKAQGEGKENYTSAADLCNILTKLYKNECLGEKYDPKMIEILKRQENNTKLPLLLPAGTVVAHKTGELDQVENDAGIIFTPKGAYVLCVLSSGIVAGDARTIIAKVSKVVYNDTLHTS
ncbi:serine hydrolase [Desulfosporosinus sp. FKA]|uniref:serine hydrolase n=1 Tax=Desulfosporosinus sp. FKA TaxID=1969834 RepID=UPI000B498136|nr:serine hydrolase [Desulfosporosinus sp. FKA]